VIEYFDLEKWLLYFEQEEAAMDMYCSLYFNLEYEEEI
jgi:hypothetical protein